MEAEGPRGRREFVTRVPLHMTAIVCRLQNFMMCSGEVRKNILYNLAVVIGSVVRFERRDKFASSGVHLRAHSDKILRFL